MTNQEKMLAKKRGRPATGRGDTIGVRIHAPVLAAVDAARADLPDDQTRPEMIRRILTDWLRERGYLR